MDYSIKPGEIFPIKNRPELIEAVFQLFALELPTASSDVLKAPYLIVLAADNPAAIADSSSASQSIIRANRE